ncbi:hypothetical protein C8R43DRAFT_989986 [Mycena crocata]|nr:hypothetical protein C8R43DRAFT_989986 [Mycena crocata]
MMSTIPRLPVELMENIISAAWHLPLSVKERFTLMRSCMFVNSTWADIFDLISSRDVYIPSPAFCDHFLQRFGAPLPKGPEPSLSPKVPKSSLMRIPRVFRQPSKIISRSTTISPKIISRSTIISSKIISRNLACQSITIQIANVHGRPYENGRMDVPMGAVLDELLENLEAFSLAPNLRCFSVAYFDAGFYDIFYRHALAALSSQITHLELRYLFSAETPGWLVKSLQEKEEQHRNAVWNAPSVTNLLVSGAGERTIKALARTCPNARVTCQ